MRVIHGIWKLHIPRIFDRFVNFDWYDGIIDGFVRCSCSNAWFRSMLVGWKAPNGMRIYVLQEIANRAVNEVFEVLGAQPSWPTWTPHFDDQIKGKLNLLLAKLESQSGDALLLASTLDLGKSLSSVGSVTRQQLPFSPDGKDLDEIVDQPLQDLNSLLALASASSIES